MAREYIVGTVDDTPLLMVAVDGKNYLVDLEQELVFEDTTGIPQVTDEGIVANILKVAKNS